MKKIIYDTQVEDSFLQARGPFRIHTSGSLSFKIVKPNVSNVNSPVIVSKTEIHGKAFVQPQRID